MNNKSTTPINVKRILAILCIILFMGTTILALIITTNSAPGSRGDNFAIGVLIQVGIDGVDHFVANAIHYGSVVNINEFEDDDGILHYSPTGVEYSEIIIEKKPQDAASIVLWQNMMNTIKKASFSTIEISIFASCSAADLSRCSISTQITLLDAYISSIITALNFNGDVIEGNEVVTIGFDSIIVDADPAGVSPQVTFSGKTGSAKAVSMNLEVDQTVILGIPAMLYGASMEFDTSLVGSGYKGPTPSRAFIADLVVEKRALDDNSNALWLSLTQAIRVSVTIQLVDKTQTTLSELTFNDGYIRAIQSSMNALNGIYDPTSSTEFISFLIPSMVLSHGSDMVTINTFGG